MPNRVDSAYAYYIKCVVNITVVNFYLFNAFFDMTYHMNLRDIGSIPVEGSSKNTTAGLPIRAIANESFLLLPPESAPASAF
jgi:hypothetical protein